MGWFKEWFTSPYYSILYKNRNEGEAVSFIDKLLDFRHPSPHAKVLVLACGKGRHAVYLASKDLEVTGIDLSVENINAAKKFEKDNPRTSPLPPSKGNSFIKGDNLKFLVHDMREVLEENYFDYVFNFFTSFGYFEDDKDKFRVIEAIDKELKNEGIFIIDFLNVTKVLNTLIEQETKTIDGIRFHINRRIDKGYIVKKIIVEDSGSKKRFTFEERVRAIGLKDFEKYFIKTHLKIINLFGNYHLDDFKQQDSDRLIIIAQNIEH